jgi:PAS domain S-box-containing protein
VCEALLEVTAQRVLRATIDEQLTQLAQVAADQLDAEAHARLTQPNQLNGADYRAVVAPLRRLLRSLPQVRYIYSLRASPDGPVFAVDAAPPLDTDDDGVLDQSALGEVYESPDPAMLRALATGEPTVTSEPYSDRWGTFISAYHPVRTADGRLEAVVGVDVGVRDYLARAQAMRTARNVGLWAAFVVSLALGLIVLVWQRARLRADARLSLSEARFRGYFDLGAGGMAVLDPQDRVLTANASLARLLGRPAESLVGQRWTSFVRTTAESERPGAIPEADVVYDAELSRPDGLSVEVEVARRAVLDARGALHHHVVAVSDVSARNRAQRELARSLQESEATLHAIATLARDPAMVDGDLSAAARALTPLAAHALDVARASVWRYADDAASLVCLDQFTQAHGEHTAGQVLSRAEFAAEFAAFEAGPYVDADDAATDPRLAGLVDSYIRPAGIMSMLDVRVRAAGRLLGVVCFEHVGRQHTWTPRELAAACQLADQVALAMLHHEARATAEQLREARDAAAAASHAKGQFVATMSHEIRTPINGVLGFAELLSETGLGAEQREYVGTIRSCGETLLTIINDVLDFSKIEAGKLELGREVVELPSLIREVTRLVRPRADQVPLDVELAGELPARVWADGARLRQVLLNLLSNAMKFTPRGRVCLRASAEGVDRVRFVVEDTGVGIPAAQHGRIFGEFSQADASTTRRFGGTGLGLAISKRLVELMGGEIGFVSEPGVGSTFWFTATLAHASLPSMAAAAPDRTPVGGTPRVLVAEDNAANQLLIRRLLERLGCEVRLVNNGRFAVAACAEATFDLVLMDCQMPELDGLDATREIRRHERCADRTRVPIVALTANAMTGDREACVEAGMDDYLTKPIRLAELRAALVRLAPSCAERPTRQPATAAPTA